MRRGSLRPCSGRKRTGRCLICACARTQYHLSAGGDHPVQAPAQQDCRLHHCECQRQQLAAAQGALQQRRPAGAGPAAVAAAGSGAGAAEGQPGAAGVQRHSWEQQQEWGMEQHAHEELAAALAGWRWGGDGARRQPPRNSTWAPCMQQQQQQQQQHAAHTHGSQRCPATQSAMLHAGGSRPPAPPSAPPPASPQHLRKRIQRGPVRGISLKLQASSCAALCCTVLLVWLLQHAAVLPCGPPRAAAMVHTQLLPRQRWGA